MVKPLASLLTLLVSLAWCASTFGATHDVAAMDAPASPVNTFVTDSFTGAAGTSLVNHTGETGATWTPNVAGTSTGGARGVITAAGRLRQSDSKWKALYYASGQAASADYTVSADVYVASALARVAVVGRESTTADTGYAWEYDAITGAYSLLRGSAGTYTTLCSYSAPADVGSTHRIDLVMKGSQLTGRVDGADRCTTTDAAIAAAGRPGLRLYLQLNGMADSAGAQLDDFSAAEVPSSVPDVVYSGLRVDRTWSWNSTQWNSVDALKAWTAPGNFLNGPLPDGAALDTGTIDIGTSTSPNPVPVNPAAPNELQRQATTYGTYLNRSIYTTPITVVPPNQPLVPVRCIYNGVNCSQVMRQISLGVAPDLTTDLHGGFPIPDDYVPSDPIADTDGEAVFYQPDYSSPCNGAWRGRFYEAWKLKPNPAYDPAQPVSTTNPKWQASSVGRVVDAEHSPGHYKIWTTAGCNNAQPGAPESTYQYQTGMGVLASGLFIVGDEVSREDCRLGQINHAVGLLTSGVHPGFRWPATRSDGSQPTYPLLYGMRLRFPPGMAKPAGLTRMASMLFDAAKRYGFVLDDTTGGNSIGFRVEPMPDHTAAPECTALLDGKAAWAALNGLPWSQLQVLAVGSDANPTP